MTWYNNGWMDGWMVMKICYEMAEAYWIVAIDMSDVAIDRLWSAADRDVNVVDDVRCRPCRWLLQQILGNLLQFTSYRSATPAVPFPYHFLSITAELIQFLASHHNRKLFSEYLMESFVTPGSFQINLSCIKLPSIPSIWFYLSLGFSCMFRCVYL